MPSVSRVLRCSQVHVTDRASPCPHASLIRPFASIPRQETPRARIHHELESDAKGSEQQHPDERLVVMKGARIVKDIQHALRRPRVLELRNMMRRAAGTAMAPALSSCDSVRDTSPIPRAIGAPIALSIHYSCSPESSYRSNPARRRQKRAFVPPPAPRPQDVQQPAIATRLHAGPRIGE